MRFKAFKVIPIELIVGICVQSKAVLCDATVTITTVPPCVVKCAPVSPSPVSLITRISPSKPEEVALRNTVEVSDDVVLQCRPRRCQMSRWMKLVTPIFGRNPVNLIKNHPVTACLVPGPSFRATLGCCCSELPSCCQDRCFVGLKITSLTERGYFLSIGIVVTGKIARNLFV